MSFKYFDRVKETSTTTGTGTLTLAGAVSGFRSFTSVFSDGDTMFYGIIDQSGANWEVGLGTFTASGTKLARTTIISSSNANAAVNFTSAALYVFNDYPATALSLVPQTLTQGTTVSFDAHLGKNAALIPAQNFTLSNPTNLKPGDGGKITITQDSTGSRVITYDTNYKFAGGVKFILSTAANAVDVLEWYSPDGTLVEVVGQPGFA